MRRRSRSRTTGENRVGPGAAGAGGPLPPHLVDDGRRTLERLVEPFGLPDPLR